MPYHINSYSAGAGRACMHTNFFLQDHIHGCDPIQKQVRHVAIPPVSRIFLSQVTFPSLTRSPSSADPRRQIGYTTHGSRGQRQSAAAHVGISNSACMHCSQIQPVVVVPASPRPQFHDSTFRMGIDLDISDIYRFVVFIPLFPFLG